MGDKSDDFPVSWKHFSPSPLPHPPNNNVFSLSKITQATAPTQLTFFFLGGGGGVGWWKGVRNFRALAMLYADKLE